LFTGKEKRIRRMAQLHLTEHMCSALLRDSPLPFGTFLPSVATSYVRKSWAKNRHKMKGDIEMNNLGKFLVNAKRNTYAAQKGKVPSSRKYSKDLEFEENDYYYLDSYFGEKDFSGEEIVYFKELPIWSMNYYGKMIKENIPEGFIEILREALQKASEDKPFRGPEEYIRGKYKYRCSNEGNIDFFHGTESIFYENEEVYRLYFHGGCIK